MTHYLRFPNEITFQEEAIAASLYTPAILRDPSEDDLPDAEPIEVQAGYYHLASHEHAMDVIGIITEGGSYDPETGEELEAPIVLDGWHVNYIGELPTGWDQYIVFPASPVRKFAGVD